MEKPCCAGTDLPAHAAFCSAPAKTRWKRSPVIGLDTFSRRSLLKRGLVRHFDRLSDFRKARRLILATLDDADTLLLLAIRTNYLQALANDEGTKAVLFCGEIGGDKEYAFAEAARRFSKPIIAMVVGRHAPAQKQMGHAGALIGNWRESAQAKLNALTGAGCHVAMGLEDAVTMARALEL